MGATQSILLIKPRYQTVPVTSANIFTHARPFRPSHLAGSPQVQHMGFTGSHARYGVQFIQGQGIEPCSRNTSSLDASHASWQTCEELKYSTSNATGRVLCQSVTLNTRPGRDDPFHTRYSQKVTSPPPNSLHSSPGNCANRVLHTTDGAVSRQG